MEILMDMAKRMFTVRDDLNPCDERLVCFVLRDGRKRKQKARKKYIKMA